VPAFERGLSTPLLLWLGRNSYSLYLVHALVLVTLTHLLSRWLDMRVIAGLVLLCSLAAAEAMYWGIERPSIDIGRSLMGRRVIVPQPATT
jgi:peptidoglycan/LPS O-acetylase OafA/YrhL